MVRAEQCAPQRCTMSPAHHSRRKFLGRRLQLAKICWLGQVPAAGTPSEGQKHIEEFLQRPAEVFVRQVEHHLPEDKCDCEAEDLALALRACPRCRWPLPAVFDGADAVLPLTHFSMVAMLVGVDNLRDFAARGALEPDGANENVGPSRPVLVVPEGIPEYSPLLIA